MLEHFLRDDDLTPGEVSRQVAAVAWLLEQT
jgi:hypothetical protein